ncbi:tetratricopeptide repeat protein [Prosthecobacter sp.]|uniref:tetratricopeptide repeat protein n=1 Tax=Prosthecobacter sp. TaxID=1965333 RepID=UPI001D565EAA|nr:tetratricopeptide repeat protein [Prosthecobacter sp.]MCB1277162.1 tetratricopeptide repeat protein [Prosthecobacter sp.]
MPGIAGQLLELRRLVGTLALALVLQAQAQTTDKPWAERETKLANEYLSLLVQQPEYGRVLDLLWDLYDKHDATKLLVENVSQQAEKSKFEAVKIVEAHLIRKSGDLKRAAQLYDELLKTDSKNLTLLQSRAAVARELSDPATAFTLIKKAAELVPADDPQGPQMWIELGGMALAGGKNAEAADAYERAAKLKPQDIELARQVAQLLLQAGFPDRAAGFFAKLADQTDPQRKLDALYDLARIYEHADQFAKADKALTDGLALLHFRDGRYLDFFRRRVRLHERFGTLDDLEKALVTAAKNTPPSEQALLDAARYFELTVEPDEQLKWLRALVQAVPQVEDYRWELVRTLLDHEGAAEAAKLLDERLKNDGSDLPAIVMLRCEADLRNGDAKSATARLLKMLEVQDSTDVEKQTLVFAQTRTLDAVVEKILRARVQRDPQKAEAVFDLAAFFRGRRDVASEDKLLREFTSGAANEEERQKRLSDASSFLAASNNLDSAIIMAREAVSKPGAGREQWLQLAELLAEQGENEEAAEWVEKAWHASTTDEDRVDVDERLLSILMGDTKVVLKSPPGGGDFVLPDAFTGTGFASDDTDGVKREKLPDRVLEFAQKTISEAKLADARSKDAEAARFRGFWWAVRTSRFEDAYDLLNRLEFDPVTHLDVPVSLVVEQLKLDLAQEDENVALMERQLRRLSGLDASGRIRYTLRLAELLMESERRADSETSSPGWKSDTPFPPPGVEASKLLENAYREFPESGQLLSALSQIYFLQRRTEDALALWKQAVKRVEGPTAIPLMESYADILLRQHRIADHVEVQAQILERETDVKRRREVLRRCIDRLTFSDSSGGELAPSVMRDRLKLLERALLERVQRHPFDGFYHEALAQVFERGGDHVKAFASMKQAYYTSPDTPFSLDQLRDAALKVADLKSAIYFQKQIAAAAPPKEIAAESRRLVELLEQTFQITEADRVRRRLESRFSQDATALDELAKYYQGSGQDEAELRVYEQMTQVRPWDGRARLRLALKCLRFADETEAEKQLQAVLAAPVKTRSYPVVGVRAPLPLTDTRHAGGGVTTGDLVSLLDFAPGLDRKELDTLRAFLGQPRAEFAELPEDASMVRLRAIEELARLRRANGGDEWNAWIKQWNEDAKANEVEKLWAFYYAGAGTEFRTVLAKILPDLRKLEEQFAMLWLTLRSNGMDAAVRWAGEKGWSPDVVKARAELLQACVSMLVDVDSFRFRPGELAQLGAWRVLRNAAIVELTRKLQDKQRYDEALALGSSLPLNAPEMEMDYSLFLARIAESAERWDLARKYLDAAVRGPVAAENYRTSYDPFLLSLTSLSRVANSEQQREETLRSAWRRLQRTQPSAMTSIRKAAVAGLAGADQKGAETLGRFLSGPFLAQRDMTDTKGSLLSQGASRYEEPPHLRSLWEETREIQALMVQQGLGGVVDGANTTIDRRYGTTMLGPRSDSEFGEWRINDLIGRLRTADYPTRRRLIREHLAAVDLRTEHSVDTLGNLGSRLESAGMVREAIDVYAMLPDRAPSNPDYALWMLRVSENAMEIEPGRGFALKLLLAEPPLKPPQPGDDTLREKHALFLARDFNVDELRRQGFRDKFTQVLERRRPHEVSYLRELGLLHERMQNDHAALSAWDRLHACYVANDQAGTDLDVEASLHRAQILQRLGQPQAALKVLRDVPLAEPLEPVAQEVLKLRCQIATAAGDWNDVRELMTLCVERKSLPCVVALAAGLRTHDRPTEALNLLTQADRTIKGDHERFTLRLEQLKVLAADPGWAPERGRAQIAALFRTTTRDRDTLKDMHAWLKELAKGKQAAGWIAMLRTESRAGTDRPLAALALSAFTSRLPQEAHADFVSAWQQVAEKDRLCIELAAEEMLQSGHAAWAWDACEIVAGIPTFREQGRKLPLAVRVAHALHDEASVRELFSETLRLAFPGGAQTIEWARAFEDTGHANLARELFEAALQRLEGTASLQPELFAAYARFLMRQQEFEAAESYLMRMNWTLPAEAAKLIFELYQSWGRLPGIEAELPKFHLPGGVTKEILFLTRQPAAKPTPQP